MLNLEAGREFFDTTRTGCDWTTLIHYLLRTTFDLPLRTRDMDPHAPRGTTSDLDRMGFANVDPGLGSEFVPPDRIAQLGGGTDIPRDVQVAWSDRPGEGRVIVIETDEGHG
jgi:hypothetical protein